MKAKELIYNLRSNLEASGSQIQNTTDQHIMFMLDEARAKLAAQKMDAKVNVVQMAQFVDVIPTNAKAEELGSIGDTKILSLVIPDPIAYLNGEGIFTVGSTDGMNNYSRTSYTQIPLTYHTKYTNKAPKWFLFENKIYIINAVSESLQKVRVRGIFDEPYKVEVLMGRFNPLDPFDFEYPLSMKDADSIYKIAMAGDMGWGDTAIQAVQSAKSKQDKDQEFVNILKGLTQQKPE